MKKNTIILTFTSCVWCPYFEPTYDETCVMRHPYCSHPKTNIYTREYNPINIEDLEVIPDNCPLQENEQVFPGE